MLNWRLLAEKRIEAAMERGEFDDLPGQGQPLKWRDNPFLPREWWLAFHLLEQAGLAPDWVMRDAEIRSDLAALQQTYEQQRCWMEARRAALAALAPESRSVEQARLRQVQAQTWERIRELVIKVNRKIFDFNLIVPVMQLQRAPLVLAEVQAALHAAWGALEVEESR